MDESNPTTPLPSHPFGPQFDPTIHDSGMDVQEWMFICWQMEWSETCMPAGQPVKGTGENKKTNCTLYIAMHLRSSSSCQGTENHEMRHQIFSSVGKMSERPSPPWGASSAPGSWRKSDGIIIQVNIMQTTIAPRGYMRNMLAINRSRGRHKRIQGSMPMTTATNTTRCEIMTLTTTIQTSLASDRFLTDRSKLVQLAPTTITSRCNHKFNIVSEQPCHPHSSIKTKHLKLMKWEAWLGQKPIRSIDNADFPLAGRVRFKITNAIGMQAPITKHNSKPAQWLKLIKVLFPQGNSMQNQKDATTRHCKAYRNAVQMVRIDHLLEQYGHIFESNLYAKKMAGLIGHKSCKTKV